jgi:hypothetical protein
MIEYWNDLDGVSKAYTDWKIDDELKKRIVLTQSYYLSAYDTTTQTNGGATFANIMAYNGIDLQFGIEILTGTQIWFPVSGIWNIQFSAQVDKTDSGTDNIEIWIAKNGVNVPNTATTLELEGNNAEAVAAWNWLVQSEPGDYYEILWHSNDTDIRLLARAAETNPDRPEIPSVILTVTPVSPTWQRIY